MFQREKSWAGSAKIAHLLFLCCCCSYLWQELARGLWHWELSFVQGSFWVFFGWVLIVFISFLFTKKFGKEDLIGKVCSLSLAT